MIDQIEYRGFTIGIHQDENPEDPRNWDTLGTMACWHSRYNLGDEQPKCDVDEWLEDIEDRIAVLLPLYLYDHGSISISTGNSRWPFNCPWDSGQVGWVYVTKEQLREEYGVERISKKTLEKATGVLVCEVGIYSQYLSGEVFGYGVRDKDGEWLDGCSGFYGHDFEENGLMAEAQNAINWRIKRTTERHVKQLKAWIRHDVPFVYRQSFSL